MRFPEMNNCIFIYPFKINSVPGSSMNIFPKSCGKLKHMRLKILAFRAGRGIFVNESSNFNQPFNMVESVILFREFLFFPVNV